MRAISIALHLIEEVKITSLSYQSHQLKFKMRKRRNQPDLNSSILRKRILIMETSKRASSWDSNRFVKKSNRLCLKSVLSHVFQEVNNKLQNTMNNNKKALKDHTLAQLSQHHSKSKRVKTTQLRYFLRKANQQNYNLLMVPTKLTLNLIWSASNQALRITQVRPKVSVKPWSSYYQRRRNEVHSE